MAPIKIRSVWAAAWVWVACLASGCDLINPTEPIPAYLRIADPILILPTGDTVRSVPQRPDILPDVWLQQGGTDIGVFEMPVVVPVDNLSEQAFFLQAGVWENGNINEHVLYPFIFPDTAFLSLTARDTAVFQPVFRYRPDTIVQRVYYEGFENFTTLLEVAEGFSPNLVSTPVRVSTQPFEGQSCGYVRLDTARSVMALQTSVDNLELPRGRELWVEVTYRGNVKLGVNLQHYFPGTNPGDLIRQYVPNGVIIPTPNAELNNWQTVYYNFRPLVAQTVQGYPHRLFIFTQLPEGRTESELYLDNIRIYAFQ